MLLNLKPGLVPLAHRAILWTVLFSVAVNMVDFIDPMFSRVDGRAAGFYINPNISGRMLSFGMVAALPLVPGRLRLLFCLLVGVGVFITFSRSGWLNWAVGIIALTASGHLVFRHKWPSILFFSLLGLAIVYSLVSGIALELLSALNLSHYLTPDTLARISGFETSFADHSTSERARLAQHSWEVIQQHPLLGTGTDLHQWFTRALPHNMFLLALAEAGVPGLLLFLALLWLLWRNTDDLGRAMLSVYIFSSLFTHNNLEEPATLLILALIASRQPLSARAPHRARQPRHPPDFAGSVGRNWEPQSALWSQQRLR
jgi:O-antigen ligase